jgi:hypothetical protein
MQAFRNIANDALGSTHNWTAPAGVTSVMVEMWGGGGGGSFVGAGAGAGYSRGVIAVTPGTVYTINVASGGIGGLHSRDGGASSMNEGSKTLIFADGGGHVQLLGFAVGKWGPFRSHTRTGQ